MFTWVCIGVDTSICCWGKTKENQTQTQPEKRKTERKGGGEAALRTISGRIRSVFLRDRRSSKLLGKLYKLCFDLNGLKFELGIVLDYGLERESRERERDFCDFVSGCFSDWKKYGCVWDDERNPTKVSEAGLVAGVGRKWQKTTGSE